LLSAALSAPRRLPALLLCIIVAGAPVTYGQSDSPDTPTETPAVTPASPDPDLDSDSSAVNAQIETGSTRQPSFITRMRAWAKNAQLIERMNGDVNGWYPRIGGVTRGSGLAGGGGYRFPLFGNALLADLSGGVSTRGYFAAEAKLRVFHIPHRLEIWTEARIDDFPEEDFYGIGMTSPSATRTSYDLNNTDVRTRLIIRPLRWARVTALVGFARPDVGRGEDGHYPSIEALFNDAESPGLLQQPDFLHTTVTGEIDYRDTGGNASRGGYYRASFSTWNDVTLNAYDFHRTEMLAVQYVPLTPGGAHVLSGRVGAVSAEANDGNRIPFYFLSYVGGMDTIRSLPEFRYKDRNALWFSGEYKWRVRSFLSVSTFADVGQVSPDWQSVRASDMKAGYGVGVAFYASSQTLLRIDVGTGAGQGWQLFVRLRPPF
jgi:hypothetical protein